MLLPLAQGLGEPQALGSFCYAPNRFYRLALEKLLLAHFRNGLLNPGQQPPLGESLTAAPTVFHYLAGSCDFPLQKTPVALNVLKQQGIYDAVTASLPRRQARRLKKKNAIARGLYRWLNRWGMER